MNELDLPAPETPAPSNESQFRNELTNLINRYSMENGSNTPDFLLAEYLTVQLNTWDQFVGRREVWHGRKEPLRNDGGGA